VVPGAQQTTFVSGGVEAAKSYPGGARYFLLKLGYDLKFSPGWSTPLLFSSYDYTPAGGMPHQPLMNGWGALRSETAAFTCDSLRFEGRRAPGGKHRLRPAHHLAGGQSKLTGGHRRRNAGFVTVVKTNKTFEVPNFLEIVSDYGCPVNTCRRGAASKWPRSARNFW